MIRFMQFRAYKTRVIFAKGNFCDNIYLWFRGYRRHETLVGFVMAKFISREGV